MGTPPPILMTIVRRYVVGRLRTQDLADKLFQSSSQLSMLRKHVVTVFPPPLVVPVITICDLRESHLPARDHRYLQYKL